MNAFKLSDSTAYVKAELERRQQEAEGRPSTSAMSGAWRGHHQQALAAQEVSVSSLKLPEDDMKGPWFELLQPRAAQVLGHAVAANPDV
eukprot:5166808-Alexandrium_andersonii.AAC.1